MPQINPDDYTDEATRPTDRRSRRTWGQAWPPRSRPKKSRAQVLAQLVEPETVPELAFNPTLQASKHEREWIHDYLGRFYEARQITDVLHQVKGGKEATVYCCAAHPITGYELLAAKVYRPRMFRQLRNDARYRHGRAILDGDGIVVTDDRTLRAVREGSSFGRRLAHTSWLAHEFQTMERLHQAGGDVPRPLEHSDNAILMEYIGAELAPAPALHEVRLRRDEVLPLFRRLLHNVALLLSCGRVHADLSAFNVLYWEGDVWLIDFPQAVDPAVNPDALAILQRDVTRLCQYFGRYGLTSDPLVLADELWTRHVTTLPRIIIASDWSEDEGVAP